MPTPVKRVLSRAISASFGEDGKVVEADGLRFVSSKDRVFARLLLEGYYEPLLTKTALSLVRKGDHVVDVGANFGWYTVQMARAVGDGGRVSSFEPMPSAFQKLSKNIELNGFGGLVQATNAAVGAQAGSVQMSSEDSERETALSYVQAEAPGETQLVALDTSLSGGPVSFMKIDVEGFEQHVLQGAGTVLGSDSPPWIQVELNDHALERAGTSRAELVDLLGGFGYTFHECHADGGLIPMSKNATDVFARPAQGEFRDRIAVADQN